MFKKSMKVTSGGKLADGFLKGLKGFLILIVILILAGGSFYSIKEEEQAVVCTFGTPKAVTASGLHFKIPLIQTVEKVNTTIQGFDIGYDMNGHGEEAIMITSDYNFIHVDFYAEYRVTDPVKALYASEEPEEILTQTSHMNSGYKA